MIASSTILGLALGSLTLSGSPSIRLEIDEHRWDDRGGLNSTVRREIVLDPQKIQATLTGRDGRTEMVQTQAATTFRIFTKNNLDREFSLPTRAYDGFTYEEVLTFLKTPAIRESQGITWCPWFRTKTESYQYNLFGKKFEAVRLIPATENPKLLLFLGPVEVRSYEIDAKGTRRQLTSISVVTDMRITIKE